MKRGRDEEDKNSRARGIIERGPTMPSMPVIDFGVGKAVCNVREFAIEDQINI